MLTDIKEGDLISDDKRASHGQLFFVLNILTENPSSWRCSVYVLHTKQISEMHVYKKGDYLISRAEED